MWFDLVWYNDDVDCYIDSSSICNRRAECGRVWNVGKLSSVLFRKIVAKYRSHGISPRHITCSISRFYLLLINPQLWTGNVLDPLDDEEEDEGTTKFVDKWSFILYVIFSPFTCVVTQVQCNLSRSHEVGYHIEFNERVNKGEWIWIIWGVDILIHFDMLWKQFREQLYIWLRFSTWELWSTTFFKSILTSFISISLPIILIHARTEKVTLIHFRTRIVLSVNEGDFRSQIMLTFSSASFN